MLGAVAGQILLIGACYLAFSLARNLADASPVFEAVRNGWQIIRLEDAVQLDQEWNIQREISELSTGFLTFLTYFYAVGMWVGLGVMAAVLYWKRRAKYFWLRNVFLATMAGAVVIYLLYPLAPPRFLPGFGMTDTVREMGLDPYSSWKSALVYNRYAAMPSLHYTWALLVTVACFQFRSPWPRMFGVAFQALMLVAIVATANHYLADAAAGVLLLGFSVVAVRLAENARARIRSSVRAFALTAGRSGRVRALTSMLGAVIGGAGGSVHWAGGRWAVF